MEVDAAMRVGFATGVGFEFQFELGLGMEMGWVSGGEDRSIC